MIQDDIKNGIIVKVLTNVICNNEEDALNQLFEGVLNRTVAKHNLNQISTRSGFAYTMHLEIRSRVESSEKQYCLNLTSLI